MLYSLCPLDWTRWIATMRKGHKIVAVFCALSGNKLYYYTIHGQKRDIFNHVPSIIACYILILYKANISDTCVYL